MSFMSNILSKSGVSALAVGAALALSPMTAEAATVTFGPFPTAAQANPEADSTTGDVFENFTGSIPGVRRSPWQGSAIDENAADSFYTSVSASSSATYNFTINQRSVSFLWGSPDSYNDLDIVLSLGGGSTVTVNGSQAQGPVAIGAQYVTISGVGEFDSLTFRSGQNAFEYANLETLPVPLPAGGLLLITALGGMAVLRRRRKAA